MPAGNFFMIDLYFRRGWGEWERTMKEGGGLMMKKDRGVGGVGLCR